jgi:GNAT superfamily N-acetyltransferase
VTDEQAWRDGWAERRRAWFGAASAEPEWVEDAVRTRLSRWDDAVGKHLVPVEGGWLALLETGPPRGIQLVDVFIEPGRRGRGLGRAALEKAMGWAAGRTDRLSISSPHGDPAVDALLAPYPMRAMEMVKPLSARPQVHDLTAQPMNGAEFEPWIAAQHEEYAQEMARSGLLTLEQARERAIAQHWLMLPDGYATAGHAFLDLRSPGGERVGFDWLEHHYAPHTTWVHKVEVAPEHRGKGLGRAAMLLGEAVAIDAGDTQMGLNVFGGNDVAIALYLSLGYRPVQVFRTVET